MNQNWLSPQNLENYAQAINHKGAPLTNCWGFIDGTVRPVSNAPLTNCWGFIDE